MGTIARIAGRVGLGIVAIAGFTTWKVSGRSRPWPPYTYTPFEINMEAEDVRFTAADGVGVAGWWFEEPDSDVVVICSHGHRGGKADMLGIGPQLHRRGFSSLIFDFRGQGDSDDGPQSLGLYEQQDLRAAIDWVAARRPEARIVLLGFSMGAAVSILVGADDERVRAFVLDSPFATAAGVVASQLRSYQLPARLLMPLVEAMTRAIHGYRLRDVRPVDAIGRIRRPMLLMHGECDHVTPFADSRALRDAADPELLDYTSFADVDHCGGYFADRPAYVERVDAFIRRSL